jgi:hypothetical protein
MGVPLSDSNETKLCRSSRGVQLAGSSSGVPLMALRKSRRTCDGSSGVPTAEANTSPCSCQRAPATARSRSCSSRCLSKAAIDGGAKCACGTTKPSTRRRPRQLTEVLVMHRSRVCHFVIDVSDLDQGVSFWAAALGAVEEPLPEISSQIYRHLRLPDSEIRVLLQKTNDPKASKERMHLDLETMPLS